MTEGRRDPFQNRKFSSGQELADRRINLLLHLLGTTEHVRQDFWEKIAGSVLEEPSVAVSDFQRAENLSLMVNWTLAVALSGREGTLADGGVMKTMRYGCEKH